MLYPISEVGNFMHCLQTFSFFVCKLNRYHPKNVCEKNLIIIFTIVSNDVKTDETFVHTSSISTGDKRIAMKLMDSVLSQVSRGISF